MDPEDTPSLGGHSGSESQAWERVQRLFHEALDLEPDVRERLLSSVSQREPALADEVRSLLSAHAESSGFLATPPTASILPTASPGDRLGHYRIVEEVGRGGMGVVYRATRDDESFEMDVAIKLIDPGMRSDEVLKRFRAERQILAMLEHPNIARLIDGGTAPDGGPYLVMEYVTGRPLLGYCDDRRLTIDDRLALFLVVCDAVQFAHQRLIVHRDLKSENILVTEDGSPRLLDFGIAKLLSPEGGAPAATVTAPMNRMLTPDYASPEQVRGEPATVTSDVYSLGVVLYELLTGARPHHFTSRTPEEILRVVTQVDPPRPSTVAARSPAGEAAHRRGDTTSRLTHRLAGDLDFIVLKALEKDPARRYGSVEQLAQDLRRHLEGTPVLARGRSTAYLVSRFVRRHRAAVVTAGLVALSLIGGLAGTAWQASVARQERDRATRRFNDVRQLAHAVMFDIHDAIVSLPGSTKARALLVDHALRYLDDLSHESRNDLALQHELGDAYAKIGDVQGRPEFPNLGQTTAALRSYQKAVSILRSASEAAPDSTLILRDLIVVTQRMADLLGAMGRHEDALKNALSARERIVSVLARRPDDLLFQGDLCVACDHLIDLKLAVADTAGALEECVTNVALAEKLWHAIPAEPECRRGVLIATAKMANLRGMRGERDSALVCYLRSEELARVAVAALPNNTDASRDLSIVYGMHGLFLADGGDVDSAIVVYGRGMKITEDLIGTDPANALQEADLAQGHYELGTILVKGRRYHDAERRFTEAFEHYGRLAAADTTNADHRTFMARSSRAAGEACQAQWRQATSEAERSRCRTRALMWLLRSRDLYHALRASGALAGEETRAPAQLDQMVADLQTKAAS
jgi:non-specific serine/threonine protein kinase/serine/threonine-protein kinase